MWSVRHASTDRVARPLPQTSDGSALEANTYPFTVCSDKPISEAVAATQVAYKHAFKELSERSDANNAARAKSLKLLGELTHLCRGTITLHSCNAMEGHCSLTGVVICATPQTWKSIRELPRRRRSKP